MGNDDEARDPRGGHFTRLQVLPLMPAPKKHAGTKLAGDTQITPVKPAPAKSQTEPPPPQSSKQEP